MGTNKMKFLLLTVALVYCAKCVSGAADDVKTQNEEPEVGGLDDDEADELTLISSKEEENGGQNAAKFSISRKAALMCNLVKNITEGDKTAGVDEGDEIEIKKVYGPVLSLFVDYLKHHDGKVPAEITKPIRSVLMTKVVEDPWDAEFINKQTKEVIFQIILAANYMDIKSLLHLGCAKIATLIKGKSPEEIKRILGDNEEQKADQKAQEPAVPRRRLLEAMSQF